MQLVKWELQHCTKWQKMVLNHKVKIHQKRQFMHYNSRLFLFNTGNEKIADLLIKAGIDINAKNGSFRTALDLSAMFGTGKIADLLLNAKANVSRKTVKWAIQSGHRDALEEALRKNGKKIVHDRYIEDDIQKP